MFGQKTNGGTAAPSGIQLMLRSLGFDPEQFMGNMESAKQTALEVIKNFDQRLRDIEANQKETLKLLHEIKETQSQMLCAPPQDDLAKVEAHG